MHYALCTMHYALCTDSGHNMKLHLIIIQLIITIFLIFVFPIYSFANNNTAIVEINKHISQEVIGTMNVKQ